MLSASLKLMRFDKPIGIYLLLWPTCWALWLSNRGLPPLPHIVIFLLGTIFMRAAGCIINDIADRDIDPHVERTHARPLAAKVLSVKFALGLCIILLGLSASLLWLLPLRCFYLALVGLALTVIYPFCKRFFKTPQFVLGLAFSWGIPMAYAATLNRVPFEAYYLMGITWLWIVVYDTMYAMADKRDDLLIGVHSTAIFLGDADKWVIALLQFMILLGWLLFAITHAFSSYFYPFFVLASCLFIYQQWLIRDRVPSLCFKAFLNNHWFGFVMWLAILFS